MRRLWTMRIRVMRSSTEMPSSSESGSSATLASLVDAAGRDPHFSLFSLLVA
jgi:hypothetical protein